MLARHVWLVALVAGSLALVTGCADSGGGGDEGGSDLGSESQADVGAESTDEEDGTPEDEGSAGTSEEEDGASEGEPDTTNPDVGDDDGGSSGETADEGGSEDTGPGEEAPGEDSGSESPGEDGGTDEEEGDATDTNDEGETTDEEDGGTEASEPEDCANGVDDDGDNLIDCDDPDPCASYVACVEANCGNGTDDDGDGTTDCADPDCSFDDGCSDPSCGDYFDCRVEEGCGCTLGEDCPTDDDAASQCALNCQANPACDQQCFSEMKPEFQQAWSDLQSCLQDNCQGLADDAFFDCLFDYCVESYADCFQVGEETECAYLFEECFPTCPAGAAGDDCRGDCVGDLNGDAYLDYAAWSDCRADLCDEDGDGFFDSDACIYASTFGACAGSEQAGTCSFWGAEDGTGCGEYVACFTECELGDAECLDPCIAAPNAEAFNLAAPVFECIIATCGTMEDGLTSACAKAALADECATEANACGYGDED